MIRFRQLSKVENEYKYELWVNGDYEGKRYNNFYRQ